MYSTKQNVGEAIALLQAHGVKHVVVSPGSRNAPLVHNLTQHPHFEAHVVVDERNAAFVAIGIILHTRRPVVVCCTSGTALLNYAPAVAEAFYLHLPLIVISADRSPEWIGQMDGQTIPQPSALQHIVKKSVNIPEIHTDADRWFATRLLNEALLACTHGEPAPVHINVPISEPLFDFTAPTLPQVRKIELACSKGQGLDTLPFRQMWQSASHKMIVVGQSFPDAETDRLLALLAKQGHCVVLAEHLANVQCGEVIGNFDQLPAVADGALPAPELLITFGGHIVSKRLKQYLRKHRPALHWHVSLSAEVVDLFQCLTHVVEAEPVNFLHELAQAEPTADNDAQHFAQVWQRLSAKVAHTKPELPFSDLWAMEQLMATLPAGCALHLANSSAVRNAQYFPLQKGITTYCCRGTNGIESSLPAAIGFALVAPQTTYLAIGDLSFFYSVGALWNLPRLANLRIVLFNNGGGDIFHQLPQMNSSPALAPYFSAEHGTQAEQWATAAGLHYCKVEQAEDLPDALRFLHRGGEQATLLEVITHRSANKQALQAIRTAIEQAV